MNSSSKSFFAVAVVMLFLLTPVTSKAVPIFTSFIETETTLSFALLGGPVTMDVVTPIIEVGDYWNLAFVTSEDDAGNDIISIIGLVQHTTDPHPGDLPVGPVQGFNLTVNAADAVGGNVTKTVMGSVIHQAVGHKDNFTAELSANVLAGNITAYTFIFNGEHVPVSVPEPSIACMLLLGITSLGISFKRIRYKA